MFDGSADHDMGCTHNVWQKHVRNMDLLQPGMILRIPDNRKTVSDAFSAGISTSENDFDHGPKHSECSDFGGSAGVSDCGEGLVEAKSKHWEGDADRGILGG
eukprot:5550523-Pyramimonas_sp.AAC.1